MSRSLSKLVDTYYKITRKDNPKRVYALFSDNPTAKFEDTHSGVFPDNIIKFKETISDSINGVDQAAGNTAFVRADSEPKMSAVAKHRELNVLTHSLRICSMIMRFPALLLVLRLKVQSLTTAATGRP